MNQLERYKSVIQQIETETKMMGQMKFDSQDLERDLMSAHNLKMNLYCRNVLSMFETKASEIEANREV